MKAMDYYKLVCENGDVYEALRKHMESLLAKRPNDPASCWNEMMLLVRAINRIGDKLTLHNYDFEGFLYETFPEAAKAAGDAWKKSQKKKISKETTTLNKKADEISDVKLRAITKISNFLDSQIRKAEIDDM